MTLDELIMQLFDLQKGGFGKENVYFQPEGTQEKFLIEDIDTDSDYWFSGEDEVYWTDILLTDKEP